MQWLLYSINLQDVNKHNRTIAGSQPTVFFSLISLNLLYLCIYDLKSFLYNAFIQAISLHF